MQCHCGALVKPARDSTRPLISSAYTVFIAETLQPPKCIPQKVLTSGRKVDVRKGLPPVHFSAQPETFVSHKPPNV